MHRSHINTKYDEELSLLKQKILRMGELVENNVVSAISSVINRDPELAQNIIESDQLINELEVDTEEMCLRVIALRQPAGRDLRFISTAMKVTTTLERMGDLATNIARRSVEMVEEPLIGACLHLPIMAEATEDLVRRSLESFVNEDVESALEVCRDDSYVNETYKKVIEDLLKMMGEKSILIPTGHEDHVCGQISGTDRRSCRSYVRDGRLYGGRKDYPSSTEDPGLSG